MSNVDLGFLVISVMVAAVCFGGAWLARLFRRDRIFVDVAPGMLPLAGQSARDVRVRSGQEYSGEVAVAFAPPRGLRPGLVGTIVDGRAEMRDIAATIVDLAVRGHLRIESIDADARRAADPTRKNRDWRIEIVEPAPADRLSPFEDHVVMLLRQVARPDTPQGGPLSVTMSEWTARNAGGIRNLQRELYAQTVANGWYDKSPDQASAGCLGPLAVLAAIALAVLAVLGQPSVWTVLSAAVMVGSGLWLAKALTPRVPRTALGTAAMVQALGFKKYLATAEAAQFDVEEAAGIFSRYLPYAIVFGVADHWAKVFGEVARHSAEIGGPDLFESLFWFDVLGGDTAMFNLLALGDADLFSGLGELAGGVMELSGDFGDVAGVVGDFASGVADFISDIDFDF